MLYEMEIAREKELAREEGLERGLEQGRQEGRLKLIRQAAARIRKGMDLPTIADHLEEEEKSILPIYDLIVSMPGAGPEEILKALYQTGTEKRKEQH